MSTNQTFDQCYVAEPAKELEHVSTFMILNSRYLSILVTQCRRRFCSAAFGGEIAVRATLKQNLDGKEDGSRALAM